MNAQSERMGRLIDNLLLMFIGLKLAGFLAWSWWWVLSPLWGSFCLGVAVMLPSAYRRQKQRREWKKLKEQKAARYDAKPEQ